MSLAIRPSIFELPIEERKIEEAVRVDRFYTVYRTGAGRYVIGHVSDSRLIAYIGIDSFDELETNGYVKLTYTFEERELGGKEEIAFEGRRDSAHADVTHAVTNMSVVSAYGAFYDGEADVTVYSLDVASGSLSKICKAGSGITNLTLKWLLEADRIVGIYVKTGKSTMLVGVGLPGKTLARLNLTPHLQIAKTEKLSGGVIVLERGAVEKLTLKLPVAIWSDVSEDDIADLLREVATRLAEGRERYGGEVVEKKKRGNYLLYSAAIAVTALATIGLIKLMERRRKS